MTPERLAVWLYCPTIVIVPSWFAAHALGESIWWLDAAGVALMVAWLLLLRPLVDASGGIWEFNK